MVRLWCPVVLWMALIFAGSTDLLSSRKTSRVIGPLLRFFIPTVTDDTIRIVQTAVRKTGHLTEYAILAALAYRAFSNPATSMTATCAPWGNAARQAWLLSAFYAATDEIHQTFVSSRQGSPWDWLLDAFGAFAGLCVVRWWVRVRTVNRLSGSDAVTH